MFQVQAKRAPARAIAVAGAMAIAILTLACTSAPLSSPIPAGPTAAASAGQATPSPQSATVAPTQVATSPPTSEATVAATATAQAAGGCADLVSTIPTEADGVAIAAAVITPDMLGELAEQAYAAIVSSVNASPDDLTLVLAQGGQSFEDQVNIRAFCIADAPAEALLQGESARLLAIMVAGTQAVPRTLGGKDIVQFGEQDPDFPKFAQYVYGNGDSVWTVQAGREDLAAAIIEQLP